MRLFICERCGYNSKRRGNLVRHVHRTTICPALLASTSIDVLRKQYGLSKLSKITSKKIRKRSSKVSSVLKHTQSTVDSNIKCGIPPCDEDSETDSSDITQNAYICEQCNSSFTQVTNYYRHRKHRCQKPNNIKQLLLETTKLKQEVDILKSTQHHPTVNTINNDNSMNDNSINDNSKHTDNHVENHIDNHIDNSKHVYINDYGKENVSYLSNQRCRFIVSKCWQSIPALVNELHFNDEHPENQNIQIPNKKLNEIQIRKGGKWVICDRKENVDRIRDYSEFAIDDMFEDIKDELTSFVVGCYKRYQKNRTSTEQKNKINKTLDLAILNGTRS
jgi:hypothetical protein